MQQSYSDCSSNALLSKTIAGADLYARSRADPKACAVFCHFFLFLMFVQFMSMYDPTTDFDDFAEPRLSTGQPQGSLQAIHADGPSDNQYAVEHQPGGLRAYWVYCADSVDISNLMICSSLYNKRISTALCRIFVFLVLQHIGRHQWWSSQNSTCCNRTDFQASRFWPHEIRWNQIWHPDSFIDCRCSTIASTAVWTAWWVLGAWSWRHRRRARQAADIGKCQSHTSNFDLLCFCTYPVLQTVYFWFVSLLREQFFHNSQVEA